MTDSISRRRIPVWAVAGIALVAVMITTRPLQIRAFLVPHHQDRPGMAQASSSAPAFVSTSSASSSVCAPSRTSNGNTALLMTEEPEVSQPTTFREAEVLGLKLMQEGNYEDALKG